MCERIVLMKKQRGAALIIALVFLLVMTLLGTTAMQGTSQQENMAGNMRDRDLAFQAAESALRAGELDAVGAVLGGIATQAEGADPATSWTNYFQNGANPRFFLNNTTVAPTAAPLALRDANGLPLVAQEPSYVVEERTTGSMATPADTPCQTNLTLRCFRVTARGVGGSPNAIVILQSNFYR